MFLISLFWVLQITLVSGYVSEDSVKFLFYKNNVDPIEIKNNNLFKLHAKPQEPVKILYHGLSEHSSIDWYKLIIKAYIPMNYSVVAVDWASHASTGYLKAISASRDIGFLIGRFIIGLTKKLNVQLKDVHVISHSLGCHIAGYSGKFVFNQTGKKLGRITGLDPAGPLHNYVSKNRRLSDEDALLVDVIHTNAGVLGISPSVGHMDFFPNGGVNQTMCKYFEDECNHKMATIYFAESIGQSRFEAVLCDSYMNYTLGYCDDNVKSFMGDSCNFKVKGDYFLNILNYTVR